jgi:hypothetical protein
MERKYRSFAFTVRQRAGNKKATNEEYVAFIKKKDGGFACLEGEGDSLHLHCGVWLETEITKSNFNLQLSRIYEKVREDEDSVKVLRGGTRIMYNDDFMNEYLNKKDSRFIYKKVVENRDEYYPSKEEQKCAKNKEVDSVLSSYDLYIKENYKFEYCRDMLDENIDKILYDIWYKKKLFKAPRDPKLKKWFRNDLKKWMFPENFGPDW